MGGRARRELLVYEFSAPPSSFEGHLLGALERAESGGALRVVDVLVLARDADSHELTVLRHRGGAAGLVAAATDFRLRDRKPIPQSDPDTSALAATGAALAPGEAVVALVVQHEWARILDDAAARIGGRCVADEALAAGEDVDLGERVLAARGPIL
jgi:hypothetical protein